MDERRFDDLARTLGGTRSRRGLLGALLPAALGLRAGNVFADSSALPGHAEVIAHGTAQLSGQLVWRVTRHAGPAGQTTEALGFLLAAGGSLLVTDGDGARTLLTDGAAAFTPAGAQQTLARFDGGAGVGWRLSLDPASQTASAGELIFASDPFAAPSGTRALDLARDVLGRKEAGTLPDSGQPAAVLAISGALRVQADRGKTRTLNAGEADLFSGALTLTAGSKGATYVAAVIGSDLDAAAAPPTPTQVLPPTAPSGNASAGNGSAGASEATATATATMISCPSGETACGGACVNLLLDLQNCGACGNACASGEDCVSGACSGGAPPPCADGLTRCAGVCVDTSSDLNNCGGCGAVCVLQCEQGRCACGQDATACPAGCVDIATDAANCGACGNACPAGAACQGGACACPPGRTMCSSGCVDLSASPANCGSCGHLCAEGCSGGQCCSTSTCATNSDCCAGGECRTGTCFF